MPLLFNDGDLGGGEAVELVDEGIDGVICRGDVALEAFFFARGAGGLLKGKTNVRKCSNIYRQME